MITCFPTLHPDELLYSACARYSDNLRYPNKSDVAEELFGTKGAVAVVDLPNRLDYLIEHLPPNNPYTVAELINKHTLFRLYGPFLSLERARLIYDEMRRSGSNHIHGHAGIIISRMKPPDWFRYCPSCVREDKKEYGYTYWHRTHQVYGVEVCPTHAVLLETSTVRWKNRVNPNIFSSAEQSVHPVSPRIVDPSDKQHSILLKIARDVAWLLNWDGPYVGLAVLRDRYNDLLLRHGYASYGGRFRAAKLLKDFVDFYPPDLLKQLQCPIKQQSVSWIQRLLIKVYATGARPPMMHLRLLSFLDVTAEHVLTSFEAHKPFGDGPWPCLNSACRHFKQPVITDCKMTGVKRKNGTHKPHGTFRCECGFTYTRQGPDSAEGDKFRKDYVLYYGPVWERKFKRLWRSSALIKEVARELGLSSTSAAERAKIMGLPAKGKARAPKHSENGLSQHHVATHRTRHADLAAYRRGWLAHLKENPNASRSQLTRKAAGLSEWLRLNDEKWYEAHLPPKRTPHPPRRCLDRESNDIKLSAEIRDAVARLKSSPGHPVRITISEIIKEVGRMGWIYRRRKDFPLTTRTIAECSESMETFALRQVRWVEGYYSREGICPSRHKFRKTGRINQSCSKLPSVSEAIAAALQRLEARFNPTIVRSLDDLITKVA